MSKYEKLLTSSENLIWAWRKAQRLYQSADVPYDVAELGAFELDLEAQLRSIRRDFRSGKYKLSPLVLLPQPKKPTEDGRSRMRQSFHVSVRDQVAWIALVNVIGPTLDSKMPTWSYGHRLYKAAWYEQIEGRPRLELGPYRHANGSLYRRFKHSWPLFRRHISLTARTMVHGLGNPEQLDPSEKGALLFPDKPLYLDQHYWPPKKDGTLFYGSVDLEKFYPNVQSAAILRSISKFLDEYRGDAWLQTLLTRMLAFRVTSKRSVLLGDPIVEPITNAGTFNGIPTNLMVAGFLSNVAMLPLDRFISRKLARSNRIAHFRFVDDHVIIAYDFEELTEWIRNYRVALRRFAIGPQVSEAKYDPRDLIKAVDRSATDDSIAAIKSQCAIDGSNPSKLMTKTLALVSELAGSDFDILAEQSRELKLSELEWLLLADISDREIRPDTRAAFAAGQIAKLVPIFFTPSADVLERSRNLAKLRSHPQPDDSAQKGAQQQLRKSEKKELVRYRNLTDHYFKLLFQAFRDHLDKSRLMVRVLDYCRTTGQPGTFSILKYILECDAKRGPLVDYLKPLAIQTIARHIVTATYDLSDRRLLARQRLAARRYLDTLTRHRVRSLLVKCVTPERSDLASVSARHLLLVAAACSASVSSRHSARRNVSALANELGAPDLLSSSETWQNKTGSPIGVWANWLDSILHYERFEPGPIWTLTAAIHDPRNTLDWQNLRKGPRHFPPHASAFLKQHPRLLNRSDAGWLLDQQSSVLPITISRAEGGSSAIRQLSHHFMDLERKPSFISLMQWVAYLRTLSPYDPRVGEWSALEIIRQLALTVQQFRRGGLARLDKLHPTNILVPKAWLSDGPPSSPGQTHWTWETWKQVSSTGPVVVTRSKIEDYRRNPSEGQAESAEQLWRGRLRDVGLLLFGLCRRDFALPSLWNVRGLERDVVSFVKSELEETPISSCTQAIIEAAMLPRSAETALIMRNLWAFFGAKPITAINDTSADPPDIFDVQELIKQVDRSQLVLTSNQISVLNHAARQLIPMNAVQLTKVAAEPFQVDDGI